MTVPLLAGAALAVSAALPTDDALRLPNAEPLVCVYYFGHWWEPWQTDDEAIRTDFRRLREMGFNTLLCDHEWSQAIDRDWHWLDREQRLAAEEGLAIVPWLSAKTWSDLADGDRPARVKAEFGVDVVFGRLQDGSRGAVQPYDDGTIRAGAAYAAKYLERYAEPGATLRVYDGDVARPVVGLSVEQGWGGPSSFDEGTNTLFCRWLEDKYGGDLSALNAAWGTSFNTFWDVDPTDKALFDYPAAAEGAHKPPVDDHVEFRSQLVSDSLARQAALLRKTHPEVLILAEVPYQFESQHPHAISYRVMYGCNPSVCDYADIVLFRCAGLMSGAEEDYLRDYRARTGKPVVITYRTFSDWGEMPAAAELIAGQAAKLGSGLGYYSWNEMVDVHLVAPGPGSPTNNMTVEPEVSARMIDFVGKVNTLYISKVGMG